MIQIFLNTVDVYVWSVDKAIPSSDYDNLNERFNVSKFYKQILQLCRRWNNKSSSLTINDKAI